jgi:cytoskeletal protein CcmA (bactofilin family)
MADIISKSNALSSDVQVNGSIVFKDELVFDGKLEGEITSEGRLTLGQNAVINGEILAGSVIVFGRVIGNITASDRCELKSNAHLEGDLKTARLQIEEGATFVGKSEVTPNRQVFNKPEVFRPEKNQPEQQAKAH